MINGKSVTKCEVPFHILELESVHCTTGGILKSQAARESNSLAEILLCF